MFSGGATLEATEAVCDALGDLSVDALDGVSSLLEKSLLGQEEGAEGEPRFVMLETIREYAREKARAERGGGKHKACPCRILPGPGGGSLPELMGTGAAEVG